MFFLKSKNRGEATIFILGTLVVLVTGLLGTLSAVNQKRNLILSLTQKEKLRGGRSIIVSGYVREESLSGNLGLSGATVRVHKTSGQCSGQHWGCNPTDITTNSTGFWTSTCTINEGETVNGISVSEIVNPPGYEDGTRYPDTAGGQAKSVNAVCHTNMNLTNIGPIIFYDLPLISPTPPPAEPTNTATPSPRQSLTPTKTPTLTPTLRPTETPIPTPTLTPTKTPTLTPTSPFISPTVTPTPKKQSCEDLALSGRQGIDEREWEMFQNQGEFKFYYNAYTIPDRFQIYYENQVVFDTNQLVSGENNLTLNYGPGVSTKLLVRVTAPLSSTLWEYKLKCPNSTEDLPGKAIQFDNDCFLTLSDNSNTFNITDNWTLELWFKPISNQIPLTGDSFLISNYDADNHDLIYSLNLDPLLNPKFVAKKADNNYFTINSSFYIGIINNRFYHLAIVKRGIEMDIILDGELIGAGFLDKPLINQNNSTMVIAGKWSGENNQYVNSFKGLIDDLRISKINRSFNPEKIKEARCNSFDQNTLASWRFENDLNSDRWPFKKFTSSCNLTYTDGKTIYPCPPCDACDTNHDNKACVDDFSLMDSCFLKDLTENCSRYDINKDGKVDIFDYVTCVNCQTYNHYSNRCPPLPTLTSTQRQPGKILSIQPKNPFLEFLRKLLTKLFTK